MSDDSKVDMTLVDDEGNKVHFIGELLAEVETALNNAYSDYSGTNGVCHSIKCFKTAKNNFVVSFNRITAWQGETDSHQIFVGDNLEKLLIDLPQCKATRMLKLELIDHITALEV